MFLLKPKFLKSVISEYVLTFAVYVSFLNKIITEEGKIVPGVHTNILMINQLTTPINSHKLL